MEIYTKKKEIRLASQLSEFSVEITTDPVEEFSVQYRAYQRELLRLLADNPQMLTLGPVATEAITIKYDQTHWLVTLKGIGPTTER